MIKKCKYLSFLFGCIFLQLFIAKIAWSYAIPDLVNEYQKVMAENQAIFEFLLHAILVVLLTASIVILAIVEAFLFMLDAVAVFLLVGVTKWPGDGSGRHGRLKICC